MRKGTRSAVRQHLHPSRLPHRSLRGGGIAFLALAATVLPVVAAPAAAGSTPLPVVVQRVTQAFDGRSLEGVYGPAHLSVRLHQPTKPGDLLIASIDDGVVTSGMLHPHYLFTGWKLAVNTIGGETADNGTGPYRTGGLQASIYYLPDNPGGIVNVAVATVPRNTQATVTVTIAELSHAPHNLTLDATGTSTSGPLVSDYTQHSAVSTSKSTGSAPDLVVALFNNGGNSPNGEHYVTEPGWTLLGSDTSPGNHDQPILTNFKIFDRAGVFSQHERYLGGYAIDNVAVIAAFSVG